jgi:multicomponent Na+:H+ antiporter subunit E
MIAFLLRAAALLAVYLLVLTSIAPGDILVGGVLAIAVVLLVSPSARRGAPAVGWWRWLIALAGTLLGTARDIVLGTFRTVHFVLRGTERHGFVEIPRGDRSRREVALWGLLTGEAPDEYPVDVDDARDVLVVHVLDARNPAAIRERHARAHERWHRRVVE